MYDKVKEVLASETKEAAEQKLFGEDGIQINTKEYYESIISKFIKKKDNVIPKVNRRLCFDLDENLREIWNIVFISEYVQKYFFDKYKGTIEQLKQEISRETDQNKKDELQSQLDCLENCFKNIGWISIKHDDIGIITDSTLEESIKNLKQGLLIFHRMRNSFEHNNGFSIENDMIRIDRKDDQRLEVVIPADYLDGFSKGRIIAREEDKDIVEKTNNITSLIFEKYNYDLTNIESFFYNVPPQNITKLLDYFDNDVNELYKLPASAFYNSKKTIDLLDEIRNMPNSNLITKLPNGFFDYDVNGTKNLLDMLMKKNVDINVIEKLNDNVFAFADKTIKLMNKLFEKNIDINVIVRLCNQYYLFVDEIIDLLENGLDVDLIQKLPNGALLHNETNDIIKMLNKLKKRINIDEMKQIPNGVFLHGDNAIILIETLIRENVDINIIIQLPDEAFSDIDSTIELLKNGTSVNMMWKLLSNVFGMKKRTNALLERGVDIDTIEKIPFWLYAFDADYIMNILNYLSEKNIDVSTLEKMPYGSFINFDNQMKILEKKELTIDIVPPKIFTADFIEENLDFLLSRVNNNVEQLEQFPIEFFTCDIDILKEMCGKYDYNLCRSIFGINDPKKISLLLYMNNVFSKYSKDNDLKNMRLDPFDFISETAELTEEYSSVNNVSIPSSNTVIGADYINKIIYDKDYTYREPEEMQEYIIRKLRNSSAHFRYRIVKDENGNIDDDKIELYDEDNRGRLNYIGVFDMNYLLEVTRLCELDIEKKFDTEEVGRSR